MKKLESKQLIYTIRGGCSEAAGWFTGIMCMSTVYLVFSPLAPIAGATGVACGLGGAIGCIQS